MELTYVGPDSMGPHYLDSGKRPDGHADAIYCIVQTQGGNVMPAFYVPKQDYFEAHEIELTPVCWWHLPAAQPMTEREWWMQQAWNYRNDTDLFGFSFYGYDPKKAALWYNSEKVADVVNFKMAKSAAYDHWVAAGRP